ncbi:MAG TPA: dual specificity protein phosphatase [Lacipirellulaceae bacterium]|jgi:protein-tyrosine phosphatase|nr:dual specificity protein phosphatase [Lacipirellulaceae bacterium]
MYDRSAIYRVTDSIWMGPFASPTRAPALVAAKITHILNVGEAPSVLTASADGFREVVWHPIVDLVRMSEENVEGCLQSLHRMVCEPGAKVYVHCIAGQNRSPTIVWMYLVACGISPSDGKAIIERAAPDAVPGHSKLVDDALIATVTERGRQRFLPHPRPDVLNADR